MNKSDENTNVEKPVIIDKDNNEITEIKSEPVKKRKPKTLKNLLFLSLWTYFVIRVFLTDVDLILVQSYDFDLALYVFFRIVTIALIIFLVWIRIGNTRFWKNIGLLFLFPFYPTIWLFTKNAFWKIPIYLYEKKWQVLLYYYIESTIGFFLKFKYLAFKFLLLILGFLTLFTVESYWLFIPIGIFSVLQILHLIKRFRQTFSPIKIFNINLNLDDEDEKSLAEDAIKKMDESFEKEVVNNDESDKEAKVFKQMETYLVISTFARAFNLKLKEVINNRTYMLSFLGKAIFSFILAMVYFGGINYAVYKFNSDFFKVDFLADYFDFFYYSFFTIFPDGTDIEPVGKLTKSIKMLGVFVGVIINLLLLTVYLTISNEKFKENLEKLSNFTDKYSKTINQHFEKKFGHDPTEGLKRVKKVSSTVEGTISFINTLLSSKK